MNVYHLCFGATALPNEFILCEYYDVKAMGISSNTAACVSLTQLENQMFTKRYRATLCSI